MTDWASVVAGNSKDGVAPPAAPSFELFHLVENKWNRIDDIIVKSLVDGPFAIRMGDSYFAGDDATHLKLSGKRLDWSFKLVERMASNLILAGLFPNGIFAMTFKEFIAVYMTHGVFGGKFIENKTKVSECPSTQTSIPF